MSLTCKLVRAHNLSAIKWRWRWNESEFSLWDRCTCTHASFLSQCQHVLPFILDQCSHSCWLTPAMMFQCWLLSLPEALMHSPVLHCSSTSALSVHQIVIGALWVVRCCGSLANDNETGKCVNCTNHYGVKIKQRVWSMFSTYLAEVVSASEIRCMTSALCQEILKRVVCRKQLDGDDWVLLTECSVF